jgi:hypothetical protein
MLALVALALVSPVPGEIARGFAYAGDPFARGHHRGIDLAAAPGTPVKAACGGRVVFAGRAGANGRAVTIRCGRFNVTHLPLAELTTRAGATVPPGARIGTAARGRSHAGLHLGVRRANNPLGYVDPAPLIRAQPRPAPPAGPHVRPRRPAQAPPHPEPLPLRAASRHAAGRAPLTAPAPAATGSSPVAPWPVWAGLALLLAGAAGAGTTRARRTRARRRAGHARAVTAAGTVPP